MGKIKVPQAPQTLQLHIPRFLGADLTNAPSYTSVSRSTACPNMIRESAGKVRKWIGWHTVAEFDGRINGFHILKGEDGEKLLIHAGTGLYLEGERLYSDMADEKSMSAQLAGKLIIADGKKLLSVFYNSGAVVCQPLENTAFVPTVVISRRPSGGGTTYQPVNLLGDKRKDSFLATGEDKTYQLSAVGITSVDKVEKLNKNGGWDTVPATDYTVDKAAGKVVFVTAPGTSPVTGRDNIVITYSKHLPDYKAKINSCHIAALYGVNAAMDRIFLSGNPKEKNRDYYCAMDNPGYWGDLWYTVAGADNSRIMGYSIINDKLATHIDRSDNDTNIILRTGTVDEDGNAVFKISGAYQGGGAVSEHAFAPLETEPLFLSQSGVMAVTPSDVLGERYRQLRSYYLNGLLLKQDLSQAVATVYDRFYMLAAGDYLFALDGTQISTEENMPYSSRQYAGFYRTNVKARCIANINGVLTFGTEDGAVREFYTDYTDGANFNDDGQPIMAKWTTPEISGKNFYYKKRFKLIACLIGAAYATGVRIKALYDGISEVVYDYDGTARYFMYSKLQYSKLSYKTDRTAQFIREKISIKPDSRKVQFVFENDILNEPFSLLETTVEFTQSK